MREKDGDVGNPGPWFCKSCGAVLGWQDEDGLTVRPEAVERYTILARSEEIWVTCSRCHTIQIWRARVEMGSKG